MSQWGTLLAAIGQTIELAGALWLLWTAWRAKTERGSPAPSMTLGDIPKLPQRIASSGYAPGAVVVVAGLIASVVGGWMQV
jgi:threonine/homoserine/homoserine lactone efflux protein